MQTEPCEHLIQKNLFGVATATYKTGDKSREKLCQGAYGSEQMSKSSKWSTTESQQQNNIFSMNHIGASTNVLPFRSLLYCQPRQRQSFASLSVTIWNPWNGEQSEFFYFWHFWHILTQLLCPSFCETNLKPVGNRSRRFLVTLQFPLHHMTLSHVKLTSHWLLNKENLASGMAEPLFLKCCWTRKCPHLEPCLHNPGSCIQLCQTYGKPQWSNVSTFSLVHSNISAFSSDTFVFSHSRFQIPQTCWLSTWRYHPQNMFSWKIGRQSVEELAHPTVPIAFKVIYNLSPKEKQEPERGASTSATPRLKTVFFSFCLLWANKAIMHQ